MHALEKLSPEAVAEQLARLPGWTAAEGVLRREFRFPDFRSAMAFVQRVGEAAEEADHHPDIDIRYRRVIVALTTHDAGGLTRRDFELAARIDQLAQP